MFVDIIGCYILTVYWLYLDSLLVIKLHGKCSDYTWYLKNQHLDCHHFSLFLTQAGHHQFRQSLFSCQVNIFIFQTWKHFKYNLAEFGYFLKLWRGHMKKIEGHFGTGVLSYFLFLKWLFYINIPVFVLTFGFVILPQILYRHMVQEGKAYNQNVSFTGKELLTGAVCTLLK